jgi:hypothetical protein
MKKKAKKSDSGESLAEGALTLFEFIFREQM